MPIREPCQCNLTRAYWERREAKNNELVELIVEGQDCDGLNANFEIIETDGLFGSRSINSENTRFSNNRATIRWQAKWEDDNPLPFFNDDPEYIFRVRVNPEITSENVLSVSSTMASPEVNLTTSITETNGWYMAGANSQRTSWVPETLPDSISTQWVKPIYPYVSQHIQVIGAEGKVFVSTASGLYAFDAATGQDAWKYPTALPLGNSPTYDNGFLYVGGMDKKLHKISANNGAGVWAFTADGGFSTNPVVVNGKVYAGNRDGAFYAVDAATGQLLWKYQTGNQIIQSAAYKAEDDNFPSTSQGTLYFASNDGYAYALNAENGNLLWQSDADPSTPAKDKFPSQGFYAWWPVIFGDDVIFVKTGFYPANGVESAWLFGPSPNTNKVAGTLSSETQSGYWPVGEKVLDLRTNPNGETMPDYFEVQQAGDTRAQHGPFRRNAFFVNRITGLERQFDLDGDGNIDAAPISWVGDGGSHDPPIVSGNNNVLYFNSVLRARGTSFNTRAIFGWKVGTPFAGMTQSSIKSSDEPTGISAAGDKLYYNHCCDRTIGAVSISRPNTEYPSTTANREFAYISGGGLAYFAWPMDITGLPNSQSSYYCPEAVKFFWDPQPSMSPPCCPAVFWNENDKVGPSVYNGRLYTILGNSLVALGVGGTGSSAPLLPVASGVSSPNLAPSISEAQIRQRLAQEITEIVDAGHLKPSYLHSGGITGGNNYRNNDQYLNQYWHNPADIQLVLIRALPYLNSTLQTRVRTYLQNEFTNYNPSTYAHIGFGEGIQRDPWPYPPIDSVTRLFNPPMTKQTSSGGFNGWGFPPSNVYAIWKYAQAGLGNPNTLFTQWGTRLRAPITANANNLNDSYLTNYPLVANAYIAAYKGYVELAKMAGQSSSVWQPYQNELDRLLELRKNTLTAFPNWQNSPADSFRSYYRSIITYYNFAYMTPELADFLRTNAISNDPTCNVNDRLMVNCKDIQAILQKYQFIAPYWMQAHNSETQGESAIQPYQQTHSMFQALARVKKASREELIKYLDTPIVPVGDLYYIDNLIAVLEANPSGPVTNTAPSVYAGADQTIILASQAVLDSTVTDDGLPSAVLTYAWTKVSGPGTVSFGNANLVDTTAIFSAAGSYVIRLTASDGTLSSFDELTIIVNAAQLSCSLTSASWSQATVLQGTSVILTVNGNNCNGQITNFTIFEEDGTVDEQIIINPSLATFSGNTATATWTAQWQCDGNLSGACTAGDPEYYFVARLNATVSLQSAGQLAVTPSNIVQTPAINPNGGTYLTPTLVSLTSTTTGSSIYYTLDGSDPDQSDSLYSQPINLASSMTFKARAFRNGYSPSNIASAGFTINSGLGPTVSNIRTNLLDYSNNQVPKYKKFELTFDVGTSASNLVFPFDANTPRGLPQSNGITVNAHFIDPNGIDYLQPAFYYQVFDDQVKGNKEWFYPTSNYLWKVRFAPHKTGRWSYYLTAQDGSGSIQSQTMQFDVTTSDSHGFIKVSKDTRYFEYDDGSYFPALGYNYQLDNVNPRLGNANDFQVMNQYGIDLMRVWISGFSIYGEAWSKWGSPNRVHGTQEPRSGIVAPNNNQFSQNYGSFVGPTPPSGSEYYMWLEYNLIRSGNDLPRMTACRFISNIPVKQNTNYRVRVRYQDIGIEGAPGQQFGFTVKTSTQFFSNATRCSEPGAGTVIAASYNPSDTSSDPENQNWKILQGTINSGAADFLPDVYLSFNNVRDMNGDNFAGHVFVDKVWLEEAACPVGSGCPNLLTKPWMDMHKYINQRDAYSFDKVLDLASQNDIYLKAVMNEKNDRIFQTINFAGDIVPTQDVNNYYGNLRNVTKVRWLQQSWWRYIQARWGYSTNIHSWELLNEGDPGGIAHPTQADEFGKYMKCRVFGKNNEIIYNSSVGNICIYDHPNAHLVSTSFSNGAYPWRTWNNRDKLYADLDYADQHLYADESVTNLTLFNDAALFSYWLSTANNFDPAFRKPFMRGEAGWSFTGTNIFANNLDKGQWFHDYLWAGLNHGGLMEHFFATGSYRAQIININGGVVLHDHRPMYKSYYDFIKNIPLNNGRYGAANATTTDSRITAWGQKDIAADKAHIWIRNKDHTWKNVVNNINIQPVTATITIRGFSAITPIKVEWWNTYTGVATSTQFITTDSGGSLVLQVTSLVNDTAVKIGNYASSNVSVDVTPPVRSNGQPTGALVTGTTQATLSLVTNENAVCKYATAPNTAYASMPNTFTTTGGVSHSALVTGLSNGQTYTYYVRCNDIRGNANTNDYMISFAVVQPLICTDSDSDTYSAEGGLCGLRDCNDNNLNINPSMAETCNGADDNCNNRIDEDLTRLCSQNNVGRCAQGLETCFAGTYSGCLSPLAETCGNGIDENCDGNDLTCPSAPNIINLNSEYNPVQNTIAIRWTTDIPSTSTIEFGLRPDTTAIPNYNLRIDNSSLVTQHLIRLSLPLGTVYNFRILSEAGGIQAYSQNRVFATINRSASLEQQHTQLSSVIVGGAPVRIKRIVFPYQSGLGNVSFEDINWTNGQNFILVTRNINYSVSNLNQRYEINLSDTNYILFTTTPPEKTRVSLAQNNITYIKRIDISAPNHFYNVEASEEINTSFSNWKLYSVYGTNRVDVTSNYNLRLSNGNIIFSGFNTSNVTFEIVGSICAENWQCTDWTNCVNNGRARTCSDSNACGTTVNKPAEQESCSAAGAGESGDDSGSSGGSGGLGGGFQKCIAEWQCSAWEPSECPPAKVQTRECNDIKNCEGSKTETQQCIYALENSENVQNQPNQNPQCGNDIIDAGENSVTCCKDVGCSDGHVCVFNSCTAVVTEIKRFTLTSVLLCILGGLIVATVSIVNALKIAHSKKIKSTSDFDMYVKEIEDVLQKYENQGISEKQLISMLKKRGWDEVYLNEARRQLRKLRQK